MKGHKWQRFSTILLTLNLRKIYCKNDYASKLKGLKGTKQVLTNTCKKQLNIIDTINPVSLKPTIMLTEENCSTEVLEAFLEEVKINCCNAKKCASFLILYNTNATIFCSNNSKFL